MTLKPCPDCRQLIPAPLWERHRQDHRNAEKAPSAARGYGYAHQMERKKWAARVATGMVECGRCGEYIAPLTPWHLDHLENGTTWPSHQRCNQATATHRMLGERL